MPGIRVPGPLGKFWFDPANCVCPYPHVRRAYVKTVLSSTPKKLTGAPSRIKRVPSAYTKPAGPRSRDAKSGTVTVGEETGAMRVYTVAASLTGTCRIQYSPVHPTVPVLTTRPFTRTSIGRPTASAY